jgi:hypothetical protein
MAEQKAIQGLSVEPTALGQTKKKHEQNNPPSKYDTLMYKKH